MGVMNSYMEMLGGPIPNCQKKKQRIRTHSFGASWSLHQFARYSEIHPCTVFFSALHAAKIESKYECMFERLQISTKDPQKLTFTSAWGK